MNDTTRWAVDGALAGLGPGLVLAALLSEGLLLLPPVAVAVALQDPEAM